MSHVHSGFRHEIQLYPSRFSGHIRAIVWAAIAAGICAGIGL